MNDTTKPNDGGPACSETMTTYTIKPLEWIDFDKKTFFSADTLTGSYWVNEHEWGWIEGDYYSDLFPCTSIEDGRAQAEAHWQKRLSKVLVPVEQPEG